MKLYAASYDLFAYLNGGAVGFFFVKWQINRVMNGTGLAGHATFDFNPHFELIAESGDVLVTAYQVWKSTQQPRVKIRFCVENTKFEAKSVTCLHAGTDS